VVGFGDWNGPGGTCIKRRYCGPLRTSSVSSSAGLTAWPSGQWEYLTSTSPHMEAADQHGRRLHHCNRNGDLVSKGRRRSTRCSTAKPVRAQQPEEHHVEPDVNASRNILMLLMLEIRGFNRPAEFQPLPKRRGLNRNIAALSPRNRYPWAPLSQMEKYSSS
jgi:hypothetical protein